MAVKMRLRREGKKKQPFYRVVVADVRSPRDGRFIEDIGYYQPLHEPSTISIDRDRALHWLRTGVQPSEAVTKLLRIEGIWEEFKPGDPGKDRSQKHEQRAKRAQESAAKAAAAEEAAAEARRARQSEAEAEAATAAAAVEQAEAAEAVEAAGTAPVEAPAEEATAEGASAEEAQQ